MYFTEKVVTGRRYRIAAQAVWDAGLGKPFSRQVVLGPADEPPSIDLGALETVGRKRIGDVGALVWVAEKLDVVGAINRACGWTGGPKAVSIGEMTLAVAIQRACAPRAKRHLADFLDGSLARVSCLSGAAFSGQTFQRLAAGVREEQLDEAQIALARAAVEQFEITTDVLAFDGTNFDTHIATTTASELARRGHAKSKRTDLRVVGLGLLVSETGHVPLLHRTYAGNRSDHGVLEDCLDQLGKLHDALDAAEGRKRPAQRTLVRDGGSWSEQLELELDVAGYFTLVSLPVGTKAGEQALAFAAKRGSMRKVGGKLGSTRAARTRFNVGDLDRTLVVVESQELLDGQKRGISAALVKARTRLSTLERRCARGKISRSTLEQRVKKALAREHLSTFVVTTIGGTEAAPTFEWHVDAKLRRQLERTRLGKRVLCTDRHTWSTERIITSFRGQWRVEEVFRRAKKGGVVAWGPSHQWADASLRLHTFATVLGLMLVSLAKVALGTRKSARAMMVELAEIEATMVRASGGMGRRPTHLIPPRLSAAQCEAVRLFELGRWLPQLLSTRPARHGSPRKRAAA